VENFITSFIEEVLEIYTELQLLNPERNDRFGDLGLSGNIILKQIMKV
jgi:hypothetical protein